MLRRGLLAALAAITLAGFGAQAGAVGSEADALRRASERGRLIYDYDGAAWVSTDAMVAKLGRLIEGLYDDLAELLGAVHVR